LNRAAVEGLLRELGGKVRLGAANETASNESNAPLVSRTNVLDGKIAYIRVREVSDGLAQAVRRAWEGLGRTNHPIGTVLDLRYTGGEDYAAAAATADLFLSQAEPLLDFGHGMVTSTAKPGAIGRPVAVLVNGQTSGAAEALAAVLRQTGRGLILGAATAGQAMVKKAFPLKDGQRLWIATAPVRLGDEAEIGAEGLEPDIPVKVSAADELTYYKHPFQRIVSARNATAAALAARLGLSVNAGPPPVPLNEAELVREHQEGLSPDEAPPPAPKPKAQRPLVRDPALARALDLLKGLAVIRQGPQGFSH
jgi:C-terminal processing protease CtpA/Prc